MENKELAELIKQFDSFVHFSLTHKQEQDPQPIYPRRQNKVETYLNDMEKRLKLKPRSPGHKFQNLLKPMKELKSFVSVKEFMECLGTSAVGKIGDNRSTQKEEKTLKLEYENVRGGYYFEKIEAHLKSKQFKRSSRNSPYFVTELDNRSLQTSEYRTWVQDTLNKISLKNDQLFKKNQDRLKQSRSQIERGSIRTAEKDCLIEDHQKEYADQFKVVPRIRQMCTQQYQNFTKISTLLTGRLRKILKNNCTSRNSTLNLKTTTDFAERTTQIKKSSIKAAKTNKENTQLRGMKSKRVQTAGTLRREQSQVWREGLNRKLKDIINEGKNEVFNVGQ